MSTLAQTIKNEIRRISRREISLALSNIRRDHIAMKKKLAEQKSRILAIEKENKTLSKKLASFGQDSHSETEAEQVAFYARGIKSLRRRFGLSQNALGTLVGMNAISIGKWEKKTGKIKILKPEVRKSLMELKDMKKAEVMARLNIGEGRVKARGNLGKVSNK